MGNAHHFLGNQTAAQLHCQHGLALAAELGTPSANFFSFDNRIYSLTIRARALWLRGFSDQALRIAQKAIDDAASRDHHVPICLSLVHAWTLSLWAGDLPGAGDLIERLIAHAGRCSLEAYRATGIALKGELAIARDEPEVGLDLLRSALGTLRAQQYNVLMTGFTGLLAEGLRKTGQFEEALFTINEAIARGQILARNFTRPSCFGLNRIFLRRNMTVNQR